MTPFNSDQPHGDERLAELISEAVADVEPTDRLDAIRARTSARRSRHGWYAVGGAVLAAAAVVTAFVLPGNQTSPQADDPPVSGTPSPTPPTAAGAGPATPVYYVGETTHGMRLYRYFEPSGGRSPLELLTSPSSDPDYWTLWPEGSFDLTARDVDDPEVISVWLAHPMRDRPEEMTPEEAGLAVEQVIYTLQAEAGARLPVQFRYGANPIDQVLGVPTSEPLANGPQLEVLSLVSISDPAEEQVVSGSFVAKGAANSFEATVPWEIRSGDEVVQEGFATAAGSMEPQLFAWETEVDVSSLEPGTYSFVAMTSDPSDGEGPGPYVDTRTILVE